MKLIAIATPIRPLPSILPGEAGSVCAVMHERMRNTLLGCDLNETTLRERAETLAVAAGIAKDFAGKKITLRALRLRAEALRRTGA